MNVNVTVSDFKSAAVDALVIGVFEGEESGRAESSGWRMKHWMARFEG